MRLTYRRRRTRRQKLYSRTTSIGQSPSRTTSIDQSGEIGGSDQDAGWPKLRALASNQYGLFTLPQATGAGVSYQAVRSRVRTGVLEQLSAHVLSFAGTGSSFRRRAMAGVLDAGEGAVLAGMAAAALWQVPGFPRECIDVLVPPTRAPNPKLANRRTSAFLPAEAVRLHGIPVLTPGAVVLDLVFQLQWERLRRMVETLAAEGLLTTAGFHDLAERALAGRPRGAATIRELLAQYPRDWAAPASGLERRFLQILDDAGFERPLVQVNVGDARSWIGRIDVKDPRRPVLGEVNSDRYHASPLDAAADAERYAALQAAGFTLAVVAEREVWYQPNVVVERWRAALAWADAHPPGLAGVFLPPPTDR